MPGKTKETTVEETVDAKKSRLYNEALREVRDAHIEEFNDLVTAKYEAEGLIYRRRLTPEERAKEKILALAAEAGLNVRIGAHDEVVEARESQDS